MLNRDQIKKLIDERNLITDFPHLDTQIQPNGFDITVGMVYRFKGKGKVDFSNSEREIPEAGEIKPEKENEGDKYGWWDLKRGSYKVKTNEKINLPNDTIALGFPRSSLLRMGTLVQQAVWDAGFSGKGEFVIFVGNQKGIKIKENARIAQLIFLPVDEVKEGYEGVYNE